MFQVIGQRTKFIGLLSGELPVVCPERLPCRASRQGHQSPTVARMRIKNHKQFDLQVRARFG
jgi:hypothetical protein